MRTKASFRKTLVALLAALVLSSCSTEWMVPDLISSLDSYCKDSTLQIKTLSDAYSIWLTAYNPFNIRQIKNKTRDISGPLIEQLSSTDMTIKRGPEKYYRTPSDTKIWIEFYYGEHDSMPIRVSYCLLEDMQTIVVVANNDNDGIHEFWFRACWYSISDEDAEGLLNVVNETFAIVLESSADCSSDDNEEETNQSDSAFYSDIEEEPESRPIC